MSTLRYDNRYNPNCNQDMRDYYSRFPNYNMNRTFDYQTFQDMSVQRMPNQRMPSQMMPSLGDQGPEPFSFNIREATLQNNNYRQAVWTGQHLQITLMSIDVDSDIGYEAHPNLDQFIRIEQGEGLVLMGDSMDNMDYQNNVREGYAFIIPAGKWHNLINTGNRPIKLYSIYAPPEHPHGTLQQTKEDDMEME